MSEFGGYGELAGYGAAGAWDTDEGVTLSFFKSSSVGVAGDVWFAVNFGGGDGFTVETPSVYLGIGTPSGTSFFGLTGSVQQNMMTGGTYANIGVGVTDYGGVGLYGEWSPYQFTGHGYNEFHEIQAGKEGVDIGVYLDPRGFGGNWGYNAPEFDRNHYSELLVGGQRVIVATDGTRLEHGGSRYSDSRKNEDGTITLVTTNAQSGVATETTYSQTASGVYVPVSVVDAHANSLSYAYTGNDWGNDWNDPRTNVVRDASNDDDDDDDDRRSGNNDDEYGGVYDPGGSTPDDWYNEDNGYGDNFGDGDTTNDGGWSDDGWTDPNGIGVGPIILDLDGDGIEINSSSSINFDWDNDGYLERGNWAAADDGFLVIDLDENGEINGAGDGVIDQGREIAFSQWAGDEEMTDLQALAEAKDEDGNLIFDSNGDGVLSAEDDVWGAMKIFQDLDQDGEVDEGELKTLDEWGITQINLAYDDGSSFSEFEDDVVALGNILHGLASFVMNGETVEGGVGDVSLLYNTQGWRYVETDSGYQIEFEDGDEAMVFWHLDDLPQRIVNLTKNGLAGAYGDDRDNVLNATGSEGEVVITGGGGNDSILGGNSDDMLSGGQGSDTIHGGDGHDVILADSNDDIAGGAVTGGEGYDKLIVSEETVLDISDLSETGFEAVIAGNGNDSIAATDDETSYSLDGKDGDDTLTTAGGHDVLSGGDGEDSLSSGDGMDRLFGGDGNDILDAGDGADFLAGGAGNDTLLGGGGNDHYLFARGGGHDEIYDYAEGTVWEHEAYFEETTYSGGKSGPRYVNELRTGYTATTGQIDGGIDTLEFGVGIGIEDVLFSRVGDDALIELRNEDDDETDVDESDSVSEDDSITIEGWSDQRSRIENFAFSSGVVIDMSQILYGQTGHGENDELHGTESGDWLNAGGGDDTLAGNGGADVIIAGAGNDSLMGGQGRDFLFAGDGDDHAMGGIGDDYILGGSGNDTLNGGGGDDALSGDQGNDELNGGDGADILLGGSGNDTLNGGLGDDTYIYFRGDGHDVIHDFSESLQDVEEPTGETIYERSGKSGQYVEEMRTVQRVQQTEGGWDVLQFGYSIGIEDVFFELQGDDLVMGIRQFDDEDNELMLDEMDDVVTVENWTEEMSRIEELRFGDGLGIDISLYETFQSGYGENDILTGTDADTPDAGIGVLDRELDAGDNDVLSSGGDLLSGGGGADQLFGLSGNDVLVGGIGRDTLDGGAGDDDLFGGIGRDTLRGGAGADYLLGGAGADVMRGGGGNDVMSGGKGDDTLYGGLGNDLYLFSRGDGHDTINESLFNVMEDGTVTRERDSSDFSTDLAYGSKDGGNVWVSDSRTGATVTVVEGGDDTLQFGGLIDISDIIVNSEDSGDFWNLVIELEPVSEDEEIEDSITIENWNVDEFRIETFRFANGFVLDVSNIAHAKTGDETANTFDASDLTLHGGEGVWLVGAAGKDTLIGSAGGDILVGGTGIDRLRGGNGNDIYVFGRGDGLDYIQDSGSVATSSFRDAAGDLRGGDALLFGVGITIEDLILHRDDNTMNIYVADQSDMSIPLTELTDVVFVRNWDSTTNRIELLQFHNGLDFDISEIQNTYLGQELTGTETQSAFNDTLEGSNQADWIDGFAGDDELSGLDGDDFMFGRDGEDTVRGGDGDDLMAGGDGNDVLNGESGDDIITGGADDDMLRGGVGGDVLMGGTGNDTLNGGVGNDLLVGDLGDDTIIASAGQDQMRFGYGDGNDIYRIDGEHVGTDYIVFENGITQEDVWFERVGNDLVVRLVGTPDTLTFEGWFNGANAANYVAGFVFGNTVINHTQASVRAKAMEGFYGLISDGTTAYGVTEIIRGEDVGTTDERGLPSQGINDVLSGDGANQLLNGGAGDDTIYGRFGHDILIGGAGKDVMRGGQGNDIYRVDNVDDQVIENADQGVDSVISTVSFSLRQHSQDIENLALFGSSDINATGNGLDNIIQGNAGDNTINGAWGNDTLLGGAGHDTFQDEHGADVMAGGVGNDTYHVDNIGDVIEEAQGEGTDLVFSAISFALRDHSQYLENLTLTGSENLDGTGNRQNNTIVGNEGNNLLNGAWGNDTLTGGAGNDIFRDEEGDDVFRGGAGLDILYGGIGNDVLTGGIGSDSFVFEGDFGQDTITDFDVANLNEHIDLSGVSSITSFADLLNNHMAQSGDDVLIQAGGGNTITLSGVTLTNLTADDFVFA